MVVILLSTYNGEKYFWEFLTSLEAQTFKDWYLLIRDDGSQDKTLKILEEFKKNHPSKVEVLKDNLGNLKPCKSFLYLLLKAQGEYFMFADQDDVWLPQKIEKTFKKMQELERVYGKETPILVHTDLKVVDENLNLISPSFWKYQGQNPRYKSLNYLLVQNNITGCTVMINKALKEKVKVLPQRAVMHDWWLGILVSTFGIIDYIPEPTVLYRQHEKQDTGARKYSLRDFWNRFARDPKKVFEAIGRTFDQAEEFFSIYKDEMPLEKRRIIEKYLKLKVGTPFHRLYYIFMNRFFKQGFLRNIGFILFIQLYKSKNERP